jgi:hypothetical protein
MKTPPSNPYCIHIGLLFVKLYMLMTRHKGCRCFWSPIIQDRAGRNVKAGSPGAFWEVVGDGSNENV